MKREKYLVVYVGNDRQLQKLERGKEYNMEIYYTIDNQPVFRFLDEGPMDLCWSFQKFIANFDNLRRS